MSAAVRPSDPQAGRGAPTQRRVREALGRVGGYWRPLAALARVLEELGEIAGALAGERPAEAGLAEELADLWIITTALADQFLGEVPEPGGAAAGQQQDPEHQPLAAAPAPREDPLAGLLGAAGRIARIVNYYDGPKTPRSLEGWCPLSEAVVTLHGHLAALARAHGVDLALAVARKLDAIPARDGRRFARAAGDPSTAAHLDAFRRLGGPVLGLDPRSARVWGAAVGSPRPPGEQLDALAAVLGAFAKAAIHERLELCVVSVAQGGAGAGEDRPEGWLGELLAGLAARDPRCAEGAPEQARAPYTAFAFNGVSLAVEPVSSPPAGDAGSLPRETFVVFGDRRLLGV
ncbi:MAG TPA: hypothetical protein VGY13_07655 [Solirubrobacteraceae bacterium]|nr:hypothetical protein [Solirubrobacteraceae bacterium]